MNSTITLLYLITTSAHAIIVFIDLPGYKSISDQVIHISMGKIQDTSNIYNTIMVWHSIPSLLINQTKPTKTKWTKYVPGISVISRSRSKYFLTLSMLL